MSDWKEMKMSGREWKRHFDRAIGKSWIRALAELITNADDSYTRLNRSGKAASGDIIVEFTRRAGVGSFRISDQAEGMLRSKVETVFEEYGGDIAAGNEARGFFNRGAKDALLAMDKGREDTIHDDELTTVELRLGAGGKPETRIIGPKHPSAALRKKLEMPVNGTVASFALPAHHGHVPQVETVRTALARFWMLRKIVDPENANRRLLLRYRDEETEILYPAPVGEQVHAVSFSVAVPGGPSLPIDLVLKKAPEDLDQSQNSDQRVGGLLFVDEGDAVLDLSLGRFDRDYAAAPFFGEVKIKSGFKAFLRSEEKAGRAILSEERNGFEAAHAWVQALMRAVEKEIEPFILAERKARSADEGKLSQSERALQKRVLDELNKILEQETRASWEGVNENDRLTPPPGGLAIKPSPIQISEGAPRYAAVLADPKRCPPGSLIYIEDESGSLSIEPNEIKVEQDDEAVFIRPVRLSGGSAGQKGKLTAISNDCIAECEYEVVADAYPAFEGEMAFVPEEVAIVDQKTSTLSFYVRTSAVPAEQTIFVSSSEPEKVIVLAPAFIDARDVRNGVGKARLRVRGLGVGSRSTLTAKYGTVEASAAVRVRSERQPHPHKGLFKEITYSRTAPHQERVHFDEEKGNIVIHLKEPTVKQHLGEDGEYRNVLDAQTLTAELVTQTFAEEVAKRRVMSGARPYFGSDAAERLKEDLQEIRDQVFKYGAQIHKMFVDSGTLRLARKQVDQPSSEAAE